MSMFFSNKYNIFGVFKTYYICFYICAIKDLLLLQGGKQNYWEKGKQQGKNKKDVAHLGWVLIKNLFKRV